MTPGCRPRAAACRRWRSPRDRAGSSVTVHVGDEASATRRAARSVDAVDRAVVDAVAELAGVVVHLVAVADAEIGGTAVVTCGGGGPDGPQIRRGGCGGGESGVCGGGGDLAGRHRAVDVAVPRCRSAGMSSTTTEG